MIHLAGSWCERFGILKMKCVSKLGGGGGGGVGAGAGGDGAGVPQETGSEGRGPYNNIRHPRDILLVHES